MKHDLFDNLPPEIFNDILLRLDVRSIANSECVSKPWLDFLSTDEFVKLHCSKSAAALAVLTTDEDNSRRLTVFELEDEIDVESSHDHHHYNRTTINLNFPAGVAIQGSANGMLLLHKHKYGEKDDALYVCNPITREYIELRIPKKILVYGFGASKISGQHKVFYSKSESESDCRVYTLGTGLWRRIEAPGPSFGYASTAPGSFVNGNLHWLVWNSNYSLMRCACFDLETECFSTLSVPFVEEITGALKGMFVLRDCLSVCEYSRDENDDEIALWLMKEYGDDKSWTKEYVISLTHHVFGRDYCWFIYPINVFKDGDVLVLWDDYAFYYYSNKTKSSKIIGVFDAGNDIVDITSRLLTPSFLSLKRSFPMENVMSL